MAALHRLAAHHGRRGQYERALPYAWQRVELDPWREQAHRQLMRLLALNGQRGAALAQYEVCRRDLAEQLGVEPAAETSRLYGQIRDGERVDWGQDAEQLLLHETGVAPDAPVSPPPAQRRASRWRIGLSALFLAAVGAVAILFAARGWFLRPREADTLIPPDFIPTQFEDSKVVQVCEDVVPRQLCVYKAYTGQRLLMTDDLQFEAISTSNWSPDGAQIVFRNGI